MGKRLSFSEKCFSLLCKRSDKGWGEIKTNIQSQENLYSIQNKDWKMFWERIGESIPSFHNKVIVDYGCGSGFDSLFMLRRGARYVYCLEIVERYLKSAKDLHSFYGFRNVSYIDNNNVMELRKKIAGGIVDIIYCRDVMEHVASPYLVINSMYSLLKHGGVAFIGFSPLYKSPYGAHIRNKCKVPWVHLIFSEKTIITVLKKLYGLPSSIEGYLDIEGSGVNKLSYFQYLEMLGRFRWKIEINHFNHFPRRVFLTESLNLITALIPLKIIKELFIINTYVKLKKNINKCA